MNRLEKSTRRFVVDTNVFVAAVKPFSKPVQQMRKDTKTLSLLTRLITDQEIELIGNSRLAGGIQPFGRRTQFEDQQADPSTAYGKNEDS